MNAAGWILFVISAIACVAVWQNNQATMNKTRDYYSSQVQDIKYNLQQAKDRASMKEHRVTDSLTRSQEEVESKIAEKEELTKQVADMQAAISKLNSERTTVRSQIVETQRMYDELR